MTHIFQQDDTIVLDSTLIPLSSNVSKSTAVSKDTHASVKPLLNSVKEPDIQTDSIVPIITKDILPAAEKTEQEYKSEIRFVPKHGIQNHCNKQFEKVYINNVATINTKKNIDKIQHHPFIPEWSIFVLYCSFLLIALVINNYNKFFKKFTIWVTSYYEGKKAFEDSNLHMTSFLNILYLNFIITGGVFFFQLNSFYKFLSLNLSPLLLLSLLIFCIFLFDFLRRFIIRILGFIFNEKELADEYFFHLKSIYAFTGLLLLPVITFIGYIEIHLKPFFIYSGLLIIIIAFLLLIYKGTTILIKRKVSFVYVILYLCALEIIPILLLVKGFLNLNLLIVKS